MSSASQPEGQARLFFALWPEPDEAEALAELARQEAGQAGGRATRAETIHLTLAFLGDVAMERLPALQVAAEQMTGLAAFRLQLDRLHYWPHNRLRWLGCCQAPDALRLLAENLRGALIQSGFAVDRGKSGFLPHVTLIRRCTSPLPDLALQPVRSWMCREFVLVASRLDASGPGYRIIRRFPLATS